MKNQLTRNNTSRIMCKKRTKRSRCKQLNTTTEPVTDVPNTEVNSEVQIPVLETLGWITGRSALSSRTQPAGCSVAQLVRAWQAICQVMDLSPSPSHCHAFFPSFFSRLYFSPFSLTLTQTKEPVPRTLRSPSPPLPFHANHCWLSKQIWFCCALHY